jgi:large subunit ribosomal protein L4e
MKTEIYKLDGSTNGSIDLPKCFSAKIRNDLISKVIESKVRKQPYAPNPVAGSQHSASGLLAHRRHVWKSQYGRGISRVPRKVMSVRGSQFNWVAASTPNARGGRRAHPPKVIAMLSMNKINKKEMTLALTSAISASASKKQVQEKYETIDNLERLPIVVESKITTLKAKELLNSLSKILGEKLANIAFKEKSIRAGKGKLRGRKYKSNAGMLLVIGKEEKIKTTKIEVIDVNKLGVYDLARGGQGRLTLYTEQAIKQLGEKFK